MDRLNLRFDDDTLKLLNKEAREQETTTPKYARMILRNHVNAQKGIAQVVAIGEDSGEGSRPVMLVQKEIQDLRADLMLQLSAQQDEFQKHIQLALAAELDDHLGEMKKLMGAFLKLLPDMQAAPPKSRQGVPDELKTPSSR